ncbi:MAG: phage portal protein [Aeromicrobium sp.]|uniref:phage portal protein n=1 Tax=Aeromicrobium sp. TaxID=1871063 RepID=UPI0039E2F641
MGIRSMRRIKQTQADIATFVADPASLPFASPWSGPSDLNRIVVDDILGASTPVNTRAAAMRIPAVARARNLIVSTICRCPLKPFRGGEPLPDSAAPWTLRTGSSTSWQHRVAWTVDDLIFSGWSLWWRVNGADGFPLYADRIGRDRWTINADNHVEIDGAQVPDDRVILIPGLHEGVLSYGVDALADTRRMYQIVRERLENPIPALDLHQTSGEDMTREERRALLEDWRTARRAAGGAAVGYSSAAIEVRELGAGAGADLLIEARNAASLDIARVIGVGASRLDATAPKASLNYETTNGRNQEFVDFDTALYMTPIAARLSLDDVVPAGQRIAFDTTEITDLAPSPTGPDTED